MWYDFAYYKKIIRFAFFAFIIIFCFFNFTLVNSSLNYTFAKSTDDSEIENELSDNINEIVDGIDSSELDNFLDLGFDVNIFDGRSFKDVVLSILSGEYFENYNGIFDAVVSITKTNLKGVLSFIVMILVIVIISEMFKNFMSDKYSDFKKLFKVIFYAVIILIVSEVIADLSSLVSDTISKIFGISNVLFPILLNLIMVSGATGSFTVYSGLSTFLLNTGSYIFVGVLLPLSVSILVMSLVGSLFSSKRFSKTIDLLKTIFKYLIGLLFSIFGIFSTINILTSGVKDGVSLKLTKFAIKNYIPILGGYISDGFDFVKAGSVLVKNSFGVCGIMLLFVIIIKPLITYFVYMLAFKIISVLVSYVSTDGYGDIFENVSKSMGYFIAVMVGVFLIMFVFVYLTIISVSVV